MSKWTIYNRSGVAKLVASDLEYHDVWMGEEFVTVNISSATPIDLEIGDYLTYRGLTYTIYNLPTALKQARSGSSGEAFKYDNVKFSARSTELTEIRFFDIVLHDNEMHYTSMPTFQFYAETVDDFLDRIQANTDRDSGHTWIIVSPNYNRTIGRYPSGSTARAAAQLLWEETFGTDHSNPTHADTTNAKKNVNISIDKQSIFDSLQHIKNSFGLNFITRERTIVVGGEGIAAGHLFQYGKGNGLHQIERSADAEQQIVTKLFAYGSDKNIPTRYYADLGKTCYVNSESAITPTVTSNSVEIIFGVDVVLSKYYTKQSASFSLYNLVKLTCDNITVQGFFYDDLIHVISVSGHSDLDYIEQDYSKAVAFANAISGDTSCVIVDGINTEIWPTDHIDYSTTFLPNNMAVNVLMLPGFPYESLYNLCRYRIVDSSTPRSKKTIYEIRKTVTSAWQTLMEVEGEFPVSFSTERLRPFVMSQNILALGTKEGDIHFVEDNDDNGLKEVYPSVEGMTEDDVFNNGSSARLDEIVACETITDDGRYRTDDPDYKFPNFHITIPNLGFDLRQTAEDSGADVTISLTDGYCGGRDFKVHDIHQNQDLTWDLEVERCPDDTLSLMFPYSDSVSHGGSASSNEPYQIRTGDHYVLTGINIKETSYIWGASVEALRKAITWLLNNDYTRFTYLPKVDEIYMKRQDDIAKASQGAVQSMHDTLKAGHLMLFQDTDLNVDGSVFIDQLTIKEDGNNGIPTYDVVLRNDKQVGTMQRVQNQLNSLTSFVAGGGGGYNAQQIRSLIRAYGAELFLSKLSDDSAQGFISLLKGLYVGNQFITGLLGEGGVFRMDDDGKTYLEADKMYVRMKAYFDSVEIREYKYTGGNRIASVAGNKAVRVEWIKIVDGQETILDQTTASPSSADFYRCYFRASDGEDTVRNNFVVGDMVYCHITSIEGGNDDPEQKGLNQKHYWRLCIGRNVEGTLTEDGEAWIDVSNRANETINSVTYAGYQSGSDVPAAQDSMIQLGNVNDNTRQGAIIEFVTGADAPSYQIYQGIGADSSNIYSLNNKNQVAFGYNSQTGRAYMNVYGDFRFGARPNTQGSYISYNQQTGELQIKAHVEFTNSEQELNQLVQSHQITYGNEIAALVTKTNKMQEQIDGAIETYYMIGAPSLQVPPVVSTQEHPYDNPWLDGTETAEERTRILNNHVGDLYYDKSTGHGYRFLYDDDNNTFAWVILTDEDVTEALAKAAQAQATADGKSTIFLNNPEDQDTSKRYPTNYKKGDSWVLPSGSGEVNISNTGTERKFKKGSIITATADMSSSYNPLDWDEKVRYTDDSALDDFVSKTYSPFVTNITKQVDKKSETWYQPSNPSSAWDTDEKKASHVGDIWCDTSANGGKKTYIWVDNGASANPRYEWKPQDVPDEVFDKIDGKAAIYVGWNDWMVDNVSQLQDKDLFIPNADVTPTGSSVTYKANKVYRWKASNSTWNEVSYTDDTRVEGFINELLDGNGDTEVDMTAAIRAIRAAVNKGVTSISGGLILSNEIELRDTASTPKVWSGISGIYDSTVLGGGIGSWYGGIRLDYETLTEAQKQQGWSNLRWAKSLFRFDGSGYLAGGNITWDATGKVTIKDLHTDDGNLSVDVLQEMSAFRSMFDLSLWQSTSRISPLQNFDKVKITHSNAYTFTDNDVLNRVENDARYLLIDRFFDLFDVYNGNTNYTQTFKTSGLPSSTTNISIKAKFGFWTDQYLSALGQNSSGGGSGGGVDLSDVWAAMAQSTNEQINLTHLTNALAYALGNYSTKLETVQNIAVGTGLNVGSYVVTRADGTTFTFANIGSTVVDIEGYMTSGDVLPTGSDYTYVYDGYPVEFRFASSRSKQGVTTNYIVFAVNRGILGNSGSSFPYPSYLIVYSKLSSASSYTYSDTIQWGDATKFYKSLFDGEMYLPLTGGTMANTSLVTNLNADLLDGYEANAFLLKTGGTLTGNLTINQNNSTSDLYLTVQRDLDRYDSYKMEVHADAIKFLFSYYDWDTADTITETGTLKMNASGNLLYNNNVLATQTWVSSNYLSNTTTLDNIPDGTTRTLSDYVKKSYNYKLPAAADARLNSIYFIPSLYPQSSNKYEEWTVVLVDQVYVNGSWVDVDYKGDALGWYPQDYSLYRDTASLGEVLLHTDLPFSDVIEICTTPYDESTGTDAVWEGEGIPQGTAYSIGSTTYIYLNDSWQDTYTANIRTVRRWEKIGGNSGVSKIVVGSNTYNSIGDTITLGNYVSKAGDTMSGSLTFAYQSQSAVLGLVTTGTYAGRLQVGTKPLAYIDDIPSVNYPVTSVVNQTGDVTASQIGSALTAAGYALTDTWQQVSPSQAGYVPQFVSTGGAITSSTVEFVLVFANAQGETAPRWKTLPVNAFNDTTYSNATQSAAGLMSATDKTKLDGIESSANNYSLPLAASGTRGGVQVGFTTDGANRNYAVQLSNEKMYVNVPWTDTTYDLSGYLQKAGGTMTGQLNVTADVMVGTYDQGGGISNNKITVAGTVVASGGSSTYTGTLSATSLAFGFQGTTAALSLVTTGDYAGRMQVGSSPIAYLSDIPSISGYATQTWVNTQLGNYLPLSGGTIIKNTNDDIPLRLQSGGSQADCYLGYNNYAGTFLGYIGYSNDAKPILYYNAGEYEIWHKGNLTNNNQLTNGAGYITSSALSDYLPLSGGIMTGSLAVKQYIFGYNYNHAGGNAPSFVFDKPGANYTGIGANGENDTIYFSAATISDGEASWVTSYKQKWKFNGTIYQEDNAVIHAGNIGSQSVNYANSAGDADTLDGQHGSYYAAASSLGDYLPLSGGTLTGNLTVKPAADSQYIRIQSDRIRFGIVYGGQDIMGLNLQMYSNASDPAAGTRLNVGSELIAYLSDIPSVSGYYLPLSGGTMTGNILWRNASTGIFNLETDNTPNGYTVDTAGGNKNIGIISYDGTSDEGGILVGSDCCIIYNSSDSGAVLKVMDKDVSFDLSGNYTANNCYLWVGSDGTTRAKELYEGTSRVLTTGGITVLGQTNQFGRGTGESEINYNTYSIYVGTNGSRTATSGLYTSGIAFTSMMKYSNTDTYINAPQGWIGLRLRDFPGSERADLVFATKSGTDTTNTGDSIPQERMCVSYEGNVGIGTTGPSYKLEVNGTCAASGVISSGQFTSTSSSTFLQVKPYGDGTYNILSFATVGTDHIEFEFPNASDSNTASHIPFYFGWRGGIYPLAIAANTNVGIGTTSPSAKLHVVGEIKYFVTNSGGAELGAGGNTLDGISSNGTAGNFHINYNSSGDVSLCYGGGNVGIGTVTQRAKLDVYGFDSSVIIGKTTGSPGVSTARKMRLGLGTSGHSGSEYWAFSVDDRNGAYSLLQIGYTASDSDNMLVIHHDGNVGIGFTGNSAPSYKLDVNGTLHASGNATFGGSVTLGGGGVLNLGSSYFTGYNEGAEFYVNASNGSFYGLNWDSDGWLTIGCCSKFELGDNDDGSTVMDYYQSSQLLSVYKDFQVGTNSSRNDISCYGSVYSKYDIDQNNGWSVSLSSASSYSGLYMSTSGGSASIKMEYTNSTWQINYNMNGAGANRHYFGQNVKFSTYVGINTDPDTSYRLKVDGKIYGTDLYINNSAASILSTSPASGVRFWAINGSGGYAIACNGSVSATSFVNNSDARKKNIYDYNALVDVNTIAMAPAIRFTWKEGDDRDLHCGTIAQYWNAVMPECVQLGYDGYLSMQYDIISLLAAISIAKKVMNHEERITELEKENERLRTELEQLKAA